MNTDTTTPRRTRLRLNRLERWFRTHADRFTPEDRVHFRALFELAEKPHHADLLAEALRFRAKKDCLPRDARP